ncbi:MAG: hypothetical protein ACE5ES_04665 [Candidatus Nanoarchaeia archaeon]
MIRKLNIKNKNAEVASIMTWFIGFLVIFFILIIFGVFSVALSTVKGENSIKVDKADFSSGERKLENHEIMLKILNSPYELGPETIEEALFKITPGDELSEKLKSVIPKLYELYKDRGECYKFIARDEEGKFILSVERLLGTSDAPGTGSNIHIKENSEVEISSQGKKINVKSFVGQC